MADVRCKWPAKAASVTIRHRAAALIAANMMRGLQNRFIATTKGRFNKLLETINQVPTAYSAVALHGSPMLMKSARQSQRADSAMQSSTDCFDRMGRVTLA